MVNVWSFRFHDVLDPDMLHQSLEELISTGENWRKLGGRFRRNVSVDSEKERFTPSSNTYTPLIDDPGER